MIALPVARRLILAAWVATGMATAVNAECATAWVQCGGAGYGGPGCCDVGYNCTQINTYYSQCTPAKSAAHVPVPVPVPSNPGAKPSNECYGLFSTLAYNSLVQYFPNNPDSKATAYVFCTLCTSGKMSCEANVHGGRTPLIASHIHVATDGDGVNGSGPPVINFCGDNTAGMILDGSAYRAPCAHYAGGAALMAAMEGNFVEGEQNSAYTVGSRVRDIAANPGKYYFNFHSIASWTYWQLQGKGPVGMCRGRMQLSRRLQVATGPWVRPTLHV